MSLFDFSSYFSRRFFVATLDQFSDCFEFCDHFCFGLIRWFVEDVAAFVSFSTLAIVLASMVVMVFGTLVFVGCIGYHSAAKTANFFNNLEFGFACMWNGFKKFCFVSFDCFRRKSVSQPQQQNANIAQQQQNQENAATLSVSYTPGARSGRMGEN